MTTASGGGEGRRAVAQPLPGVQSSAGRGVRSTPVRRRRSGYRDHRKTRRRSRPSSVWTSRHCPLYGSCFHPEVMRQLCDCYDEVKALPLVERTGIRLALENHTETFADEILWLIDQIDHPLVGACVDTVNSMGVLENPETAVRKLAPCVLQPFLRSQTRPGSVRHPVSRGSPGRWGHRLFSTYSDHLRFVAD